MQKRRSKRLRKLLGYAPEVFAIAYLVAYVVADQLYYSTPHLAMLADMGLTTKGYWTDYDRFGIVKPLNHSLEIPLKPWFRTPPPENFESKDFDGLFVWREDNLRPLYPLIEDRIGGALVGIIPLVVKYAYKGVRLSLRKSGEAELLGKKEHYWRRHRSDVVLIFISVLATLYVGSQVAAALSDPSFRHNILQGQNPKGATVVPYGNPQNYPEIHGVEVEPVSVRNSLGLLSPFIIPFVTFGYESGGHRRWKNSS